MITALVLLSLVVVVNTIAIARGAKRTDYVETRVSYLEAENLKEKVQVWVREI